MKQVRGAIQKLAQTHGIPSWSLAVQREGETLLHETDGLALLEPAEPAHPDQVYDLASLTKVIAGVSAVAELVDRGTIWPEQPVQEWIDGVHPQMTVAHLLQHQAGYPPWEALYEAFDEWGSPRTREAMIDHAVETPLATSPGSEHAYSDLGFLTLLRVIEVASKQRIDHFLSGLPWFSADRWALSWGHADAAATEACPVRASIVRGAVHDLNAFAMGGVSTHAGLFGTARGVARFGAAVGHALRSPQDSPLPGDALRRLILNPDASSLRHRGGWDTVSRDGYTSTGSCFPEEALGHLGYTGTSLWIAPSRATSIVLLTNRIHPLDDLTGIRAFRPAVHDAVSHALGWDRGLA